MSLIRGSRLGPYEVLDLLGEGGMGQVYRARDPRLGRDIAIKVLPEHIGREPVRLAQFEREARILAGLNHPSIVVLYSVERDGDTEFLTMELVEGEDLSCEVRPGGTALLRALQLAVPLADALAAAHGRGVVHRDLKPENVRVSPEGRVKVLDFGLAKVHPREALTASPAGTTTSISLPGQVVGTIPYMAPEQIRGLAVDERTDLFAFGILLFELLTGERPFRGDSVAELCSAILRDEPAPLQTLRPDLPADLVRLAGRCLEKAPEWRIQSAKELHDQLELIQRSLQSPAPPTGTSSTGPMRELPSIAVLPFSNRSGNQEDEFFADGITEDVIAHLCKLKALRVISRTSVMPFREPSEDLRGIAAKLRVRHLLEGSIRRVGGRVRIVAQLLDAVSGEHLWAETYDRALDDIFAIQADVATQIASALRAELSPRERERLNREPTRDLQAYEHYLRGRHAFVRFTYEDLSRSVSHFERALQRDPGFALAHVGLSLAYTELGETGYRTRAEVRAKAMDAAVRAIALDPALGEAHCAKAYVDLSFDFDWKGAEAGFRRAIELNPNYADAYDLYGRMCAGVGRFDQALALLEKAHELDPLTHKADLANALLRAGRHVEAARIASAELEADPDYARLHATLGWALFLEGRIEAGLSEIARAVELTPGDDLWLAQLGQAQAMAGQLEAAREILRKLQDPARALPPSPYHLAYLHTGLGEHDAAIACLEEALEEGIGAVYSIPGSFLLTPLRAHPRFAALLRRMGLP
ncbi:MAG TPA: protein kinase [Holophagaceae bacterium]|nr:protein kinase [Holophagaceae bacterium]